MRKHAVVVASALPWIVVLSCGQVPPPAVAPAPAPAPTATASPSETASVATQPPAPTVATPSADAATKRGPSVALGSFYVRGQVPKAAARATLEGSFEGLTACYRDGLARDRLLGGGLTVRVRIVAGGSVTNVESLTKMGDAPFRECVVGAFRSLVFPEPADGSAAIDCGLLFATDDPPPAPPPGGAEPARRTTSFGEGSIGIGTIGSRGGSDGGAGHRYGTPKPTKK